MKHKQAVFSHARLHALTLTLALLSLSLAKAQAPRGGSTPLYRYEDFSQWLLQSIPELQTRPAHFVLVFDRTDSVWGNGKESDVLPTLWRRDLLGMILQEFLVEGRTEEEGDRVSILGYGRGTTEETCPARAYRRQDALALKESYPQPFKDTAVKDQGTNLDAAMSKALETVQAVTGNRNVVVLLITDDIPQGAGARGPTQARQYRTYLGRLQPGRERRFTAFLYWNPFPDQTTFTRYDEAVGYDVPQTRGQRVPDQGNVGGVPSTHGTSSQPSDNMKEHQVHEGNRAIRWFLVVLALLAASWLTAMNWWRAYYRVTLPNRQPKVLYVCPLRKEREQKIPNPNIASETLGILRPRGRLFGLGLLGFHRLTLSPGRQYALVDSRGKRVRGRGTEAGARRRKRSEAALTLSAGGGQPSANVISYSPLGGSTSGGVQPATPQTDSRAGQFTVGVQRGGGLGLRLGWFLPTPRSRRRPRFSRTIDRVGRPPN